MVDIEKSIKSEIEGQEFLKVTMSYRMSLLLSKYAIWGALCGTRDKSLQEAVRQRAVETKTLFDEMLMNFQSIQQMMNDTVLETGHCLYRPDESSKLLALEALDVQNYQESGFVEQLSEILSPQAVV